MTDTHDSLEDLEMAQLFQAARAQPMVPSQDLMARMAADAAALQPPVVTSAAQGADADHLSLWDRVSGWIPQMAWPVGLATAGLTGVWIGSGTVPVLSDQAQSLLSSDLAYELAFRMPSLTAYLGGQ